MMGKILLPILFFAGLIFAVEETVKNDSAIIYWSPPSGAYNSPENTYRLYYKAYANRDNPACSWIFMDSTKDTTLLVKSKRTGAGSFIFGVTYASFGTESEMHTSLDSTATPTQGWYLFWGDKPTWIAYQVEPKKIQPKVELTCFSLNGRAMSIRKEKLTHAVYVSVAEKNIKSARKMVQIE
jgi:hypothetical protein